MKKTFVILSAASALFLIACSKNIENAEKDIVKAPEVQEANAFVEYTIDQGQQYCDKNAYTTISCSSLSFCVKFDSTAIYQTVSSRNQKDINKLYGLSDNNAQHHQFSARFGWRWSDNALRLFAYVYNDSKVVMKEIGTIEIGAANACSIKVEPNNYVFTMNDKTLSMPRSSTTAQAVGYKLYPYFGGSEMAPHKIKIWIRDEKS